MYVQSCYKVEKKHLDIFATLKYYCISQNVNQAHLNFFIFKMADEELVKKMLRAVLLSGKSGMSLSRLQVEYKDLTGELIPHKQLGYATLDALLQSMSSIVRLDKELSGEVSCFFLNNDVYYKVLYMDKIITHNKPYL